jgi:hypothetical protein
MTSPLTDTAPAGAGARRWQPRRPPHRRGPGALSHEPATSRAPEVITGEQIRAARKLLGWRQAELAKQARIPAHSVESAESSVDQSFVPGHDMQAMRAALEAAGLEFTNGDEPGVKLKAKALKAK